MSLVKYSIAVVGPLPPPSGGMANQTLQLASLLKATGAQVETIRVNAPYRPAWVGRFPGLRASFRLGGYIITLWRCAGRHDLLHVMANSGWSWHLFAAPAVWVARLRKTPVLINYRGGEAESFFRRSWRWVKPTLDRSAGVIVPSVFLQGVFDQYGVRANIAPNIIDLSRFSAASASGRNGVSPHLVVTRNLEPIYDVATSIRAFSLIRQVYPEARLTIAGSGPEREGLENLVADSELTEAVVFTGMLTNREMVGLYKKADLMLNSSVADNSPNSLIEAMASGVPVVSSNVGGIPFLIESGVSGVLVPPKRERELADAAIRLLQDSSSRQSMCEKALEVVKRFDKERVRVDLETIYLRVLDS